jgi:Tfp pilus assembly protein PilF
MNTRTALFCVLALAFAGSSRAAPDAPGYEHCVSFPQAPGLRWSQATIDAFCADSHVVALSGAEVRDLLDKGQGKELDSRLDRITRDYLEGKLPEGSARRAFTSTFGGGDDATGALIDRWLEQSPKSPFALAARGIHRVQRAADERGTQYSDETPRENFVRMEGTLELANQDLAKALLANPRLLAAYEALIDGARMNGEDEMAQTALKGALQADPKNYYVRAAYMTMLQPRWGGSLEEMLALAKSAEKQLRKNPRLASLNSLALGERGWFPGRAGKKRDALREYENALIAAPSFVHLRIAGAEAAKLGDHQRSVELYSQVLRFWPREEYERTQRARAYVRLKNYDLARADLDQVVNDSPGYASAWREYAYLHMAQNDYQGALQKLLRAHETDASDNWTTRKLAWVYLYKTREFKKAEPLVNELIKREPKSGAAWLMRADVIQNLRQTGLRQAAENFVRYADPDDSEQRKALPKVKAWLEKNPEG